MQAVAAFDSRSSAARIRAAEPPHGVESSYSHCSPLVLRLQFSVGPARRIGDLKAKAGPPRAGIKGKRDAHKRDSNIHGAGGDSPPTFAGPACGRDEFASNRRPPGASKSDSGAGKKLCRSRRFRADYGCVAALHSKRDHSDVAGKRYITPGGALDAKSTPRNFETISQRWH